MEFTRFRSALRTLVDHQVDFILVGGVAAVIAGAPVNTFDLDIVHSTEADNVARLLTALRALDARYRHHPQPLVPNESHLTTPGHQLLMTRFGPLDVLGTIGNGRTYADLLPHSPMLEVSPGLKLKVLDLETQIAVKEEVGGEKDLAALPTLRATLEEVRRGRQSGTSTTSRCG